MSEELKAALLAEWRVNPDGYRTLPPSEEALRSFEQEFGSIPAEFREYLALCGGGIGKGEWDERTFNLPNLVYVYREHQHGFITWSLEGVFVIGSDDAGNLFGIETSTGRILLEDHNFGGIHELAPSLSEFFMLGFRKRSREE